MSSPREVLLRKLCLAFWLSLAAFAPPPIAMAQNLILNGDFDTGIEGWSGFGASFSGNWSSVDAQESSNSGSLRVVNSVAVGGVSVYARYCVPVAPGETYQARGAFLLPPGQNYSGHASIRFRPATYSNCEGLGDPIFVNAVALTPGNWQTVVSDPWTAYPWVESLYVEFGFRKLGDGGSLAFHLDDAVFEQAICVGSDTTLCLANGRFRVQGIWTKPDGTSGPAHMVQLTPDTGSLWFFKSSNVEAIIKVLNGCGVNNRYWVFAGGLTNVKVQLLVEDLERGASKAYSNPQGKPFQPIQDTEAFATCP